MRNLLLFVCVAGSLVLGGPARGAGKNFRAAKKKAEILASGEVSVGQAGIRSIDLRKNNLVTFDDGSTARYIPNANAKDYARDPEGRIVVRTPRTAGLEPVRREFAVHHGKVAVEFSYTQINDKRRPNLGVQGDVLLDAGGRHARRYSGGGYSQNRGPDGRFGAAGRYSTGFATQLKKPWLGAQRGPGA